MSSTGRWMSPDWAVKPESVPYADLGGPQTLNLYGYVRNNPLANADADGHCYPVCTVVGGAALGALAGAAAETLGEALKGETLSLTKIGSAAGAGAITGAITGLAGPEAGVLTKLGISVIGSVVGGAEERAVDGQKVVDGKKIGTDALAGVAGVVVEGQAARSMASTTVRKATSTFIEIVVDSGRRGSETQSETTPKQPRQQTERKKETGDKSESSNILSPQPQQ